MVDSVNSKPESIQNNDMMGSLSELNSDFSMSKAAFSLNIESLGGLSDAEIKFLSLSKEKKSSAKIIENLIYNELTLDNYEEMLCISKFKAMGGTINPNQSVRNIRYCDQKGCIVATVQIDTINKKIRMQNLGDVLPKQESFTPYQVGTKIQNLAKFKKWTTEDGGINQFNGNIEVRYKDENGNVMAAVITKPNGTFDTIAEYEYTSGNRSQMLLTNHYGQSKVIYDGTSAVNQLTRIDIDTDGMIIEITKVFS